MDPMGAWAATKNMVKSQAVSLEWTAQKAHPPRITNVTAAQIASDDRIGNCVRMDSDINKSVRRYASDESQVHKGVPNSGS